MVQGLLFEVIDTRIQLLEVIVTRCDCFFSEVTEFDRGSVVACMGI